MSIEKPLKKVVRGYLAVGGFALTALISGCANAPDPAKSTQVNQTQKPKVGYSANEQENILSSFLQVFHRWEGAPYQYGGTTKHGIDCSAFVQIAFRDAAQTRLPRTTYSQVKMGEALDYDNAEPGDLVFFRPDAQSRHVGVYLGDKQFMHASQSKGVIISRLDNPYWASTFWQFRRVLSPPETH